MTAGTPLTSDQVELVIAMARFARKYRQEWTDRMDWLGAGSWMSERDWILVQEVSAKGAIPFADAVTFAQRNRRGTGISEAAIAQGIARMVKDGLLKSERTQQDERRKLITLTRKAKALLVKREAVRQDMFALVIAAWQPLETNECQRVRDMFLRGLARLEKADQSTREEGE